MQVTSKGIRLNPSLRREDDIFVQLAAHRVKQAKGTPKQQIEKILEN